MRSHRLFLVSTFLAVGAHAQWLNHPSPGTPRTKDGKARPASPISAGGAQSRLFLISVCRRASTLSRSALVTPAISEEWISFSSKNPGNSRRSRSIVILAQSAQGAGVENAFFSVPEIQDLRQRIKTLNAIGDFSTIGFTMVGLGEPREVQAGVVGGSYFSVMGLHPVLGRLLDQRDDGPSAAGAAVLAVVE